MCFLARLEKSATAPRSEQLDALALRTLARTRTWCAGVGRVIPLRLNPDGLEGMLGQGERMHGRVALDTIAVRRLVTALTSESPAPPDDEALALVRIYFFLASPAIVPTVTEEISSSGDDAARRWRDFQFTEVARTDDYFRGCVKGRTETYLGYHSDPRDCHVVAEAECGKFDAFLTTSAPLLEGLGGRTESILVTTPSRFWEKAQLPRGASPRTLPAPGAPLAAVDWWRW